MKYKLISILVAFIIASNALCSCEKESEETKSDISTAQSSYIDTIIYQYKPNKKISKAFFIDYGSEFDTMFSTAKDYPYNASANTYKVMKVWRKSEPGKYFWVMIENFRYKPGDSSYVYDNNENNAKIYGRLYHWEIANECSKKIMMRLPRRKADGSYTSTLYPTNGKLLTHQDINDIMEVESIGHLPSNGRRIFDFDYEFGYYDIFLSGRKYYEGVNENAAKNTLSGWLNNTDCQKNDYREINKRAFLWTSEHHNPLSHIDSHHPLQIDYYGGTYTAFINAEYSDHYGFSVRYVFEPKQL